MPMSTITRLRAAEQTRAQSLEAREHYAGPSEYLIQCWEGYKLDEDPHYKSLTTSLTPLEVNYCLARVVNSGHGAGTYLLANPGVTNAVARYECHSYKNKVQLERLVQYLETIYQIADTPVTTAEACRWLERKFRNMSVDAKTGLALLAKIEQYRKIGPCAPSGKQAVDVDDSDLDELFGEDNGSDEATS